MEMLKSISSPEPLLLIPKIPAVSAQQRTLHSLRFILQHTPKTTHSQVANLYPMVNSLNLLLTVSMTASHGRHTTAKIQTSI